MRKNNMYKKMTLAPIPYRLENRLLLICEICEELNWREKHWQLEPRCDNEGEANVFLFSATRCDFNTHAALYSRVLWFKFPSLEGEVKKKKKKKADGV